MSEKKYDDYTTRTRRRYAHQNYKKNNTYGWIICILVAVVVALCIRAFVAEPIQVEGDSMNPSLYSHQTMLVEKVSKFFNIPERESVVIVHYPNSNNNYVKRVIGLPGETVSISDSTVYINGQPLHEDYTSGEEIPDMDPVTVPDNCIFVLGDNRANSQDSRYVGCIPRKDIVGTAVAVIWPLDQWQSI